MKHARVPRDEAHYERHSAKVFIIILKHKEFYIVVELTISKGIYGGNYKSLARDFIVTLYTLAHLEKELSHNNRPPILRQQIVQLNFKFGNSAGLSIAIGH